MHVGYSGQFSVSLSVTNNISEVMAHSCLNYTPTGNRVYYSLHLGKVVLSWREKSESDFAHLEHY